MSELIKARLTATNRPLEGGGLAVPFMPAISASAAGLCMDSGSQLLP